MKRIQIIICLLLLAACSPKQDTLGYNSEVADWKKEIIVGTTTKDDLQAMLGSPSAQSSFGDETWYYISGRKETYAFLKPEIVEQDVVRITFDSGGVVSAVDSYDKAQSKDFAIATRTTPTEGHTLGFLEQVLGNIGRFNKPPGAGSGGGVGGNPGGR